MKKGYTLVEILMCLSGIILVLFGAFTLYGKYVSSFVEQDFVNQQIFEYNTAYIKILTVVKNSQHIYIHEKKLNMGNNIIEIIDDNLYLDNELLIENSDISMYVESNNVYITVGGVDWCFPRINTGQ